MFFEATPHQGHSKHYFSYVEKLKSELAKHLGRIMINRYESLSDDSSLLSYQLWENEKSVENWRNNKMHRLAQEAGIKVHFKDFRIRVGERISFCPEGRPIKLNTRSPAKSNSLLLCVQSGGPIPHRLFAKSGSFGSVYCQLSDSKRFVRLFRPIDLFCTETLVSSTILNWACKIYLF